MNKLMNGEALNEVKFDDDVNNKIITIRNQSVILDADVAILYGVETKRVNEAIRNNPEKFPRGYVFELKPNEFHAVRSKISTAHSEHADNQFVSAFSGLPIHLEKTRVLPKAFTEKGLYMLATILKSPQATKTTIEIVEAFAKLRQLQSNIVAINSIDAEVIEPEIIKSTGNLLNDMLFSHFPTTSAETSFEFNLGVMKGKRTIKSDNSVSQSEFEELKKMMLEIKEQLRNNRQNDILS